MPQSKREQKRLISDLFDQITETNTKQAATRKSSSRADKDEPHTRPSHGFVRSVVAQIGTLGSTVLNVGMRSRRSCASVHTKRLPDPVGIRCKEDLRVASVRQGSGLAFQRGGGCVLKQEQTVIKSSKESRLTSIQEQLEQKLSQLKQFMRQHLPDGQHFLSIQSHLRRFLKQGEHVEAKQQEHQKALQETEDELATLHSSAGGAGASASDARDARPLSLRRHAGLSRLTACSSESSSLPAASMLAKQAPGVGEQDSELMLHVGKTAAICLSASQQASPSRVRSRLLRQFLFPLKTP